MAFAIPALGVFWCWPSWPRRRTNDGHQLEVEGHDWEFILNQLGISHYAHPLGYSAHAVDIVIMIGALPYATRFVLRNSE